MRTAQIGQAKSGVGSVVALMTLTTMLVVTDMTMIGPLLVDLAADFGTTVAVAGQLGTVASLPWAVAALVAGPTTDRFGRRRMLIASLIGLSVVTLLGAVAPSFGFLLAMRLLMGVVGGAAPTAMLTIVGDRVPAEQRGTAMGWVFSGFGVAAVAAVPSVGALGGALGWRWAFAAVGAVLLGFAILIWRILGPDPQRGAAGDVRHAYRRVLRAPGLIRLLGANTGERIAYVSNTLYLPPFLMQSYGLTAVHVAPALALAALGAIAGNLVGGRIADRANRPTVYAVALAVSAVFTAALFLSPSHLLLSAGVAALFGISNGASRPSFMAMASEASSEHRGTAMGVVSSSSQSGWAMGAGLGGLALGVGGYQAVGVLAAAVSLYAAAATFPLRRKAPATERQALSR